LDERARRLPDHAEAVRNSAITMLHRARRAVAPPTGSTAPGTQACLTQGVASLTRLGQPDPDAWATAAACWERLSDPWSSAVARLRESEAALSIGAASRAVESLQEAHRRASHIDAGPLLEQIAAFSRRARISVLTPRIVELDVQSIDHFGLTPREAEVLSLVTAGQTNREIGTRLYVSEKTAGVHVSNILRKLGVTSRIEAAAIAQRLGMH
ncbi:MAG: response regulator transcription factor, partial [Ilumatobacteraceae bacterium]